MAYIFTSDEQEAIKKAIDESTGLVYSEESGRYEFNDSVFGGNAVPVYTKIYEILSSKLDSPLISQADLADIKNATLWLSVAIEANGGQGLYSDIIRYYTIRQGELRLGHTFDEQEIQASSNVVARNVVNGLIAGSPENGLTEWSVPTIAQIAALDAAAIGEQLFKIPLGETDTAVSRNSAWSGTIGFSLLGGAAPYETWRLISAGDDGGAGQDTRQTAAVNRLDDFKNILFAVDSYRYATLAAIAGSLKSIPTNELVDRLMSFVPKQQAIAAVSGKINPLIQYVIKDTPIAPAVQAILDYGTDKFLAMIASAYTGSFVKEGDEFVKDSYSFFSKISLEQGQNTVTKLISDYDSWQDSATEDTLAGMALRNSLKYFSAVVVEDASILANRGLDLYSENTGIGSITKNWLSDRTAMFKSLLGKYNNLSADFGLQKFAYADMDSQYQATMSTGVANPLVIFGSDHSSSFAGASKGDHLYGGSSDDEIDGLAGDDYLEGGAGNDTLKGGIGADVLWGMEGDDTLVGGSEQDTLVGGSGNDTYIFMPGDGADIIQDVDRNGILTIDGSSGFSAYQTSYESNTWVSKDSKYKFTLEPGDNNTFDLIVGYSGGQVRIVDFQKGSFGITLNDYIDTPVQTSSSDNFIIYGDLQPSDPDNVTLDELGNLITNPDAPDIDRADTIYDTGGNTSIYSLGGDDKIIGKNGGDDLYDGGTGHDYIVADSGRQIIIGGADSDVLFGGADDDFLTGDTVMTIEDSLKQVKSQAGRGDFIDGGDGDDVIIGSSADDALWGGAGSDIISGGAGNDVIASMQYIDVGGTGPERFLGAVGFNWEHVFTDFYGKPDPNGRTTYITTDGWAGRDDWLIDHDELSSDTVYGGAGNDVIYSGQGNDILDGGADDDIIYGNKGDDVVEGGSGNDILYGDSSYLWEGTAVGNDFLNGGDGEDIIYGGGGDDSITGGRDDDVLYGDYWESSGSYGDLNGADYISGGLGNDTLYGGGGADALYGDEGNDKLYGDFAQGLQGDDYLDGGDGDDLIVGLGGNDTIYGGAGNDTINGDATDLDPSLAGSDWIDAGDGDDYVLGGGGDDAIYGGNGNDNLSGDDVGLDVAYQGNDYIDGGNGDDLIGGQGGDDTLLGGSGADKIDAGDGDNYIEGGIGNDQLLAGGGNDTYRFSTGDGIDIIRDEGGQNKFYLAGSFTPETVAVSQSADGYLRLSAGNDILYFDKYQALYESSFYFGDGTVLAFADLMRLMQTQLDFSTLDGEHAAVGGAKADNITASAAGSTLIGNQGNDTLRGSSGNDTYHFQAGDGDDTLIDSPLNSDGSVARNVVKFASDVQAASLAFEVVYSQEGTQSLKVSYPGGSITIPDGLLGTIAAFQFADGAELEFADVVASMPSLQLVQTSARGGVMYGSNSADELYGGAGADTVYGQNGSDYILGGGGNDRLYGGEGNDTLDGGADNDLLEGGAGDDQLQGGAGDDVLRGGRGNDTLVGGRGNDTLEGGEGSDTYVFNAGMQQDLVVDIGSETDTIRIDSFVDLNDLRTVRQGNDLIIGTSNNSDSLTIQGYYDNPDKWKVALADGRTSPVAELIAQLAGLPTSGLSYYAHLYERDLKAAFRQSMEADGYQIGADGKFHLDSYWDSRYAYGQSKLTISMSIQQGTADSSLSSYPLQTTGLWVLPISSSVSNSHSESRVIGSISDIGSVKLGKPTYYAAGTNFKYDLNSSIVEKRDSEGEILGYYVYPNTSVQSGSLKDFSWYEKEANYTYTIAHGSDVGERINVLAGNQFYGGSGDDTVLGYSNYRYDFGLDSLGVFISGGAGDDTLIGSDDDDVLSGDSGNNILQGGMGADTYLVDSTSGIDLVSDFHTPWYSGSAEVVGRWNDLDLGDPATDVVVLPDDASLENLQVSWGQTLAEGVNYQFLNQDVNPWTIEGQALAAEWSAGRSADALMQYTTLDISWEGGRTVRILMPHADQPQGDGIELVRFSNGTEMTVAELARQYGLGDAPDPSVTGAVIDTTGIDSPITGEHLALAGGSGNDTIRGSGLLMGWGGDDHLSGGDGDDTLRGGSGNDYLAGGNGSDVYVFSTGDGQDTIDNLSNTPDAFDLLKIDGGDVSNLWLSQSSDDLVISLLGSDDSVTVKNWFSDYAEQLDMIDISGYQYDTGQINDLVSAMSSFGAPVGGDVVLTYDQRATIDSMLGIYTPDGGGPVIIGGAIGGGMVS